jgi:hypothetical protein
MDVVLGGVEDIRRKVARIVVADYLAEEPIIVVVLVPL